MTKDFEDRSMFSGVREWSEPSGNKYRATYQGFEVWALYVFAGNAYVFVEHVPAVKTATPKQISEGRQS